MAAAAALFKWQVHARRRLVCPLKANSSKLLAVSSKQCQHARNMGPDPQPDPDQDPQPDPQPVAVVVLFFVPVTVTLKKNQRNIHAKIC